MHVKHQGEGPLRLCSEPGSVGATAELEEWLHSFYSARMPVSSVSMGSAHQMSTCRMASTPALGAAKPTGELWEAPGLFVADTSTFPTASGVNPMYTCAAVAHVVAQQVCKELGKDAETATSSDEDATSRRRHCRRGWAFRRGT